MADNYPKFAGQMRWVERIECGFDLEPNVVTVLQQAIPMWGGGYEWQDVPTEIQHDR